MSKKREAVHFDEVGASLCAPGAGAGVIGVGVLTHACTRAGEWVYVGYRSKCVGRGLVPGIVEEWLAG